MTENQQPIDRNPRFPSHALVVVKKHKLLPWGTFSGVLLDLSVGGVKVELTSEIEFKPGDVVWIDVPLAPLQIYAPDRLVFSAEIRWFDKERFRFGGSMKNIDQEQLEVVGRVIAQIHARQEDSGHEAESA